MRSYMSFYITAFFVVSCAVSGCATYTITEIPQGESHIQIDSEHKSAMLKILRQHSTKGLYITPNIPPSKLANARLTNVTPADEKVFALLDSTFFGSAENSLLIGSTGIFFRNYWAGLSPGRNFLSYEEVQDAYISKNGLYEVSIGGLNFNVAGCSMSKGEVIHILQDIQEIITHECNDDLFIAAYDGDLTRVEALLAANANVNAITEKGGTALMLASAKGHRGIVKALLAANADVNATSEKGVTALMLASKHGHQGVVEDLLAANADVNIKDKYGLTALMEASKEGHQEVVQILYKAGAKSGLSWRTVKSKILN